MSVKYAGVYLLDAPYCIDREYDYRIPEDEADGTEYAAGTACASVHEGNIVSVPFGNGNRSMLAVVNRISNTTDTPADKIKPIRAVCDEKLNLTPEMLGLCRFMKSQTLCTTGDAVHAMIPSAALSRLTEYYVPTGKELALNSGFDSRTMMIYNFIAGGTRIGEDILKNRFGSETEICLSDLMAGGFVKRELDLNSFHDKTENVWSPAVDKDSLRSALEGKLPGMRRISAPGQIAALAAVIASDSPIPESELLDDPTIGKAQLAALEKKGLLRRERLPIGAFSQINNLSAENYPSREPQAERPPLILNDEQTDAVTTLSELFSGGKPAAALLEGVTGSGKTCVMLALIDRVLDAGRGAIVLLPEIALTPQSLAIFCSRYGDRVAVIHSGLSTGERYDTYMKIRSGNADLVIGTRSAVFAPVHDLGLIVIDEEQEHTYKSDMSPRYHARDIARYRCAKAPALMLLASATPSVESRKKAEDGIYTLVKLQKRYGSAPLPAVTVADMRGSTKNGNLTPIGEVLAEKLRETYERGEQSVLFLNRRGYNNYISCVSCGEAIRCPGCSVSMTYHTKSGSYTEGELVCHWCGRRMAVPAVCPECGSEHLIRMGYGTQRVEQELNNLLPEARILRMDTDTTGTKNAYNTLLGKFRRHEADILLGTQMVTKGHDFPDVTLVGVLLADASLYYDDYRAAERTFAMLTQVIGRAGRRDKPGEAVIQTNNPEHEIIELARAQDYETFFAREIRLRRALAFPPFCDIALLTLTSSIEKETRLAAKKLYEMLQKLSRDDRFKDQPMMLFGPFEAPVFRVDEKYRMRIVVKCRLTAQTRMLFSIVMAEFSRAGSRAPALSIDFNPTNL